MLWGDNNPFYYHANLVLNELVGCSLMGDDHCGATIQFGDSNVTGHFDKDNIIFAGINNLYEGITICYPNNNNNKLTVLATSTYGKPCILCCERGQSNYQDGGRIIVDMGSTKLYSTFWAAAGQARYVVNASVWLTDVEGRFKIDISTLAKTVPDRDVK